MPDLTPDQIKAQVEQVTQSLYDAVKRGDLEPWISVLREPAGLWHLGMDVVNTREAAEEFKALWAPDGENPMDGQEMDGPEITVLPISSTSAYALVTARNRKWLYKSGEVEIADTAETWLFVLTESGWKIHSGQSAIFPMED